MEDLIIDVIKLLVSAIIGSGATLAVYRVQQKDQKPKSDLDILRGILEDVKKAYEYMKTENAELRQALEKHETRIEQLEDEIEKKEESLKESTREAARQLSIVEHNNQVVISRLQKKIKDLERKINGAEGTAEEARGVANQVKEETGELKKQLQQTGQLPDIKDK